MDCEFVIVRRIGRHHVDYLLCPWEGDDQPTFMSSLDRAHRFDHGNAQRVMWRLQERYPKTVTVADLLPGYPIAYAIAHEPARELVGA